MISLQKPLFGAAKQIKGLFDIIFSYALYVFVKNHLLTLFWVESNSRARAVRMIIARGDMINKCYSAQFHSDNKEKNSYAVGLVYSQM